MERIRALMAFVLFYTDPSSFASAGDDGLVRIWQVREHVVQSSVEKATMSQHSAFKAHAAPIHALAFHPSVDSCLVTASRTIKVGGMACHNHLNVCRERESNIH